jgi:hypothetical protein
VRGGKILAVEYFWDHAKALETMGLSEQLTPIPTESPVTPLSLSARSDNAERG